MMWGCMSKYFSKEHDILKLCDRLEGKKIHYCPDCIGDKAIFEKIKRVSGYGALKHHCVLRWVTNKHCCKTDEPITKEDLFLAIADVKASAISRKLNIGYRKGHKKQSIWNTYHVWINKEITECVGKPPDDKKILQDITSSKNIGEVFENYEEQIKQRSEDAWQCPFASLMTHSELTERWFHFLNKNRDYFKVPDRIDSIAEARKISSIIQGNNSKKDCKEGLSICFIRLKLFANQSLSRIADTEIIMKVNQIIKSLPGHYAGAQELYSLYDETTFVIPDPKEDVRDYIEQTLQSIDQFTTNYYIEGNFSRTRLFTKDLLRGYDNIFKEFEYTFYPKLDDKISPKFDKLGDEHIEAYNAKLCELCNMAESTKTFWKFNPEEEKGKIHECLCGNCFEIRDTQRKFNEAIEKGDEVPHGIGYKIAKWERERPDSRLCFIKIDLNLNLLNELFKKILLREFPLKKYEDKFNDENIGFSIIYEFLNKFREFLTAVRRNVNQGKFSKVDEKTGVSNEFEILDNFICLRFDDISEMTDVLKTFVDTYVAIFPQFKGHHDSKNMSDDGKNKKAVFPISVSATISNIKFPFFEAWRYLNQEKRNLLNVLVVRHFELLMDYSQYQTLSNLDFRQRRISTFLHKLVEIGDKTKSDLLINTEIFNNKKSQDEIFHGIRSQHYDIQQLINFYKLTGKK
jgi:hypothetical protein